MPYKNISVALSGKTDEVPLIDEAVRLALTLKADLCVLHVNHPHAGEISMMMDSLKKMEEEDFRKMFFDAGHEEISKTVKIKINTNNSVPKGISKLVKGCDLLILGHAKMGKMKEILTDSIDEMTINNVKCPVLVIRT